MELNDLREQIDEIDRDLIALLERRFDVAAGIADYKAKNALPVLDAGREAAKITAVQAQCRPETAALIGGLFERIMAASRAYQTAYMEERR